MSYEINTNAGHNGHTHHLGEKNHGWVILGRWYELINGSKSELGLFLCQTSKQLVLTDSAKRYFKVLLLTFKWVNGGFSYLVLG